MALRRWFGRDAEVGESRVPGRRWLLLSVALVLVAASALFGADSLTDPGRERQELRRGLFLDPDRPSERLAADLEHYRALSVDSVTIAADLDFLCPADPCEFGVLDRAVEAARQAGMSVVLQVNRAPGFVEPRGPAFGPADASTRARWVGLFRSLVQRFGTRVDYYEIWNEPDNGEFWSPGPDPTAYALLLRDAYSAAKGIDPRVQIVGGNLSANSIGYLQRVYDALDAQVGPTRARADSYYFDVLGVHPYTGGNGTAYAPADATPRVEQTSEGDVDRSFLAYRRLRAVTAERERAAKPLALGEFGYTTTQGYHGPVPDERRAQWLTEAYRLAADDTYVRYLTWYVHETPAPDQQGFAIHGTKTEEALASVANG